MFEVFIADCKREMRLRKMSNGDLAKKIGYSRNTIDCFFSDIKGRDKSTAVAEAISKELDVSIF